MLKLGKLIHNKGHQTSMNKQSGFSHAVLIIGLVVALIGVLGFVFWQNFIYEEPVATKTEVVTKEDSKNSGNSEVDSNKASLNIEEWQVKIPEADEFTLTKSTQSDMPDGSDAYTIYEVSTAAIGKEARALECPDDKLGYIFRTSSIQDGDPRAKTEKIAGYYYLYTPRSQAACVGDDGVGPEKLNSLMESADKTFDMLFTKMTALS